MTSKVRPWFKDRLNYLGTRMAELDLVNIAYYRGGYDPATPPLLTTAQVGRSNLDMIMDTGSMVSSYTRDYFIFSSNLHYLDDNGTSILFKPQEDDIIFDDAYEQFYCRVATINSMPHFKATNETMERLRVRTTVVYLPKEAAVPVPDVVATWLRSDALPMSRGIKPASWYPQFPAGKGA